MKKIIISSFILISTASFSQVIIGGNAGTAPANNKTAVLLEFEAGQNKGLILPYVRTMPTSPNVTPGTIILDATDQTKAKVKYYAPGNALADANGWVDLSNNNEANITTAMSGQPTAVTEDTSSKAVIGATSSAARGVLVLESTTKAMVLPHVANTDDVKDPAPGMMVYINKTGAKRLAVFNGSKWTYWAP